MGRLVDRSMKVIFIKCVCVCVCVCVYIYTFRATLSYRNFFIIRYAIALLSSMIVTGHKWLLNP